MSNRFFPWGLKLGGGGSNNAGTLSLINKLPANATFTGGEQYCEDNAETLKTAGADQAQFPGMRLVTTVADGALLDGNEVSDDLTTWGFTDVSGGSSQTGNTFIFGTSVIDRVVIADINVAIGEMFERSITVSGTGDIRFFTINGVGSTVDAQTVTLTSTPTTYISLYKMMSAGNTAGIGIYNDAVGVVASFTVWDVSLREVIPTWLPTASDGAKNHPTVNGVPQFYPNRQEYEDVGPTSEFRTTKGDTTESLDHYYESDDRGAYGPELVTNGDGTTLEGWVNSMGGVYSIDSDTFKLTTEIDGYSFLYQQINVDSGKRYLVEVDMKNGVGNYARLYIGTTANGVEYIYLTETGSSSFTRHTYTLTATSNSLYVTLSCSNASAGDTAFWDNLSVREVLQPAKTSLTPLPRDSEGRFYENLVKNGGFDVDAEWTKATGVTIADGVCHLTVTSGNGIRQTDALTVGARYTTTYTVSNYVSGNVMVAGPANSGYKSANGTYTSTGLAVHQDIVFYGASVTDLDIDNVIVTEVDALGNPTNILDGGWRENTTNHLLNSDTPATQTTGSLSTGWYSLLTWGNTGSVAVTAGTATISGLTGAASDTVPAYFEVTGAGTVTVTETGTVDKFQLSGGVCSYHQANYIPTTSATVTQPANVDDAVVWQYAGRYQDRVGYLSEEAATNLFLNSQAPVTQTIDLTAIGTGDYTLSTYGTGTATVAAGTATGTGFGASSDGTDITFNLSVVGTVTVTIAGGPPDWVQVEAGSFATSPIITVASTVTRPATVCEIPSGRYIRPNDFAAQGYCIPEGAGQTGTIWSSYTDANNYTSLGISATQVILNKRISGTSHTATVTYSHAKDTLFEWQAFFDSTDGIGLRTREWSGLAWGAWEFFATDAMATDIAVPANMQIGSIDDGAQFNGTLPHIAFKKTNNPRLYFVDQQEFKTSGGETFKTSDGDTFIVYGD